MGDLRNILAVFQKSCSIYPRMAVGVPIVPKMVIHRISFKHTWPLLVVVESLRDGVAHFGKPGQYWAVLIVLPLLGPPKAFQKLNTIPICDPKYLPFHGLDAPTKG